MSQDDGKAHGDPLLLGETEDDRDPNGYESPPIPGDEGKVKKEKRNWVPDYGDQVIPTGKGFITDFVYHTRGYMIPTLACIWSAIFLLSTAIKREAWLEWMPKALFPNLYMVIVGPAGRAKKTTAVTQIGLPILRKFRKYIRDINIYNMKYINVIKDMNSPEYVIDAMLPERKPGDDFFLVDKGGENLLDSRGQAIRYRKTSETAIIVSELSTFLSSRSYTESMSSLLLDLYDCHSDWDWSTLGRGKKTLRRMFTSLIAGTTVDGIRQSIPRAAKGDGFLSRTILVYVPTSKRQYPMPRKAHGAPDDEELARRLAWVVERSLGEYKLDEEAREEYERWYAWFYQKMEENPSIEGAISRMDVNLLKTAMLIHASRYDAQPNVVELGDLKDAIRLIDATYASLGLLLSQIGEDDILREVSRIELMLKKRGAEGMFRNALLRNARLKTDVLHLALSELSARGVVRFELNGRTYLNTTGDPWERIMWSEGNDDGDGDAQEARDEADTTDVENSGWQYSWNWEGLRSEPHGHKTVHTREPRRRTDYHRRGPKK